MQTYLAECIKILVSPKQIVATEMVTVPRFISGSWFLMQIKNHLTSSTDFFFWQSSQPLKKPQRILTLLRIIA